MEKMTVLSPWAEVDWSTAKGLNKRPDTLDGKTIGMLSHFKGHSPLILKVVEEEIKKSYQNAEFSYWQYIKDVTELEYDEETKPEFKRWLDGVDCVISAYGDAGSCAMYLAITSGYVEKCGKPLVMLTKGDILMSAKCGASACRVPNLRMVTCTLQDMSFEPVLDQKLIDATIKPQVIPTVPRIIEGLLKPLSDEEAAIPKNQSNVYAHEEFTGTAAQINSHYYQRGWTNGQPIVPPTREAVDEMLKGTDYAPDYEVASLAPLKGRITVEKIAVNAVMAGCLPVHMPILIACVEAMAQAHIKLVGWTCSVAGFAPMVVVNGPIRNQIGLNCSNNILSPYFKSNACIATAFQYIVQNLTGVRPTKEDNSYTGHESRWGICFGENEEASPWDSFSKNYGSNADNTVSLMWVHHRTWLGGAKNGEDAIKKMCNTDDPGAFSPGCSFVISPVWAQMLDKAGLKSRDEVASYISEYARKPLGKTPLRWMVDNHHEIKGAILPKGGPETSCRKYWTTEHLQIIVAGSDGSPRCVAFTGGGDHGGPAVAEIKLPHKWDDIVAEYYEDVKIPTYINY